MQPLWTNRRGAEQTGKAEVQIPPAERSRRSQTGPRPEAGIATPVLYATVRPPSKHRAPYDRFHPLVRFPRFSQS